MSDFDNIRFSKKNNASGTSSSSDEVLLPAEDGEFSPSLAPLLEEEMAPRSNLQGVLGILKESAADIPAAPTTTAAAAAAWGDRKKSPPPPLPPPALLPAQHKRNISWGQNEIFSTFPLPLLNNNNTAATTAAAAAAANVDAEQQHQKPPAAALRPRGYSDASELTMDHALLLRSDSARKRGLLLSAAATTTTNEALLTLDDVRMAHPREGEAVTYILRALDEMESFSSAAAAAASANRPRSNGGSEQQAASSIFPNLPDDAIGSFSSVQSGISETSSIRYAGSEEPTLLRSPGASHRRHQRHLSKTSNSSTRRLSIKKGLHRRSGTMEEQLFGLTAAIDALQQEHWNHPLLEEKWDAAEDADDQPPPPQGSADAIQQNASILYNRATKTKKYRQTESGSRSHNMSEPCSSISSNTGKESSMITPKWKKVRDAIRTGLVPASENGEEDGLSKKSDDGDEEVGATSGHDHDGSAGGNDDVDDGGHQAENNQSHRRGGPRKDRTIRVFQEFGDYLKPQMKSIWQFTRSFVLFLVIPLLSLAALLFYGAGNPSGGILINEGKPVDGKGTLINNKGDPVDDNQASVSWWLLFVLRQLLTGLFAKATELFFIDFLSIRSQGLVHLFGPWLTLLIMQSRGWPFVAFTWAITDFILLAGSHPFYSHWIFYQHTIQLFSESNPSGNVVSSDLNYRILTIVAVVSAVVSIKRMWLGLYLGRQTFVQYSSKLTSVMRKTLLITEVSALARKLQKYPSNIKSSEFLPPVLWGPGASELEALMNNIPDESSAGGLQSARSTKTESQTADFVVNPDDRHPLTGALSAQQQARITQLLGAWEEPRHADKAKQEGISINAILQFRRALACLNTPFLFSNAFGLANTREACVESAQKVYQRLSAHDSGEANTLSFQLLALLGVDEDGGLDQVKLKELIRLFRPDRDGSLDVLAFVKSIDQVYREIRLLRASVANSSKIDRSFENIINVGFYVVVFTIVVASLGFNPLAIFLSISGVVLAFAFMISSASSKYFEGLLFILVRRPYQIGDAIHVSNVESETSYNGSAWWTVEDVNLFTTKVVFLFTMERASLSNGSLANSRIINSSESTEPYLWTTLKFPIDVTFEKLQIFQRALEEFVKNRPREFLSFVDFRITQVEVDKGSMSYVVGAQHRSTWAEWATIMLSKADLILFCVELQKKLGIHYKTPPLPVDLSMGISLQEAVYRAQQEGRATDNNTTTRTTATTANAGGEMAPSSPDISGLQALFPPRMPRQG